MRSSKRWNGNRIQCGAQIAAALRKKLGLTIVSEKSDPRGRIYRIGD